jgi:phytoene dehydrogenase-like protein
VSASVRELEGKVGLPAPMAELASREWDAVVVGGGHNGLVAAAYLAKAGRTVLVLERRDQLGGACTIERPFADDRYLVSPCAYVVGLLDELVVSELGLRNHGYAVTPCDPHLWCGFADGTSYADFADGERTAAHLRTNGFSEADIAGLDAYYGLIGRARAALRHGDRDSWVGPSPTRAELEGMLGDPELIDLVFNDSIAEVIRRYVSDPRLHQALWGQGVIGTDAGPETPGTAGVKLMHSQGTLDGVGGSWGFVKGGMGTISFAIADAAIEAGATIAAGVPVARVLPGEGVELESGETIRARSVLSNADPKRLRSMLPDSDTPSGFASALDAWKVDSPVGKLNAGLTRMPRFSASADGFEPTQAMVSCTIPMDQAQAAWETARRSGGPVRIGFAELYFHTAYDPSVAPEGRQTMSVFAEYVPIDSSGAGETLESPGPLMNGILDAIEAHAPDIRDCLEFCDVLGPADIEERIGLTGGHIFQGSALPDQMWEHRFSSRTPIDGLYMCGAATHPGGSVIGLNGRNAAMAAIEDLG